MSDEGGEKVGSHDFGFLRRKREREGGESPSPSPYSPGDSPGTSPGDTSSSNGRTDTTVPVTGEGSPGDASEGDPGSPEGESRDAQPSAEPGGSDRDVPKRGRHRRGCECERCIRRREAAGTEAPGSPGQASGDHTQGIPRQVSWDEVFQAFQPTAGRKIKPADAFAGFYSLGFDLVSTAGYGDHWKISKEDAKQLGQCTAACFDTVGGKARARAEAFLLKWAPWAALAGTATIITYPRIRLTQQMMRYVREEAERVSQHPANQGPSNPSYSGPVGPSGSPPDYSAALHEQPFEDRRRRVDPSTN